MTRRRVALRLALAVLPLLVVALSVSAVTATNAVPGTQLDEDAFPIGPDDLKPNLCDAITVTTLVTGAGVVNGTNGSDLVVGGAGVDDLRGKKGNDCLVAGGGNDDLRGDQDVDVCIGGPGTDTFRATCEVPIP